MRQKTTSFLVKVSGQENPFFPRSPELFRIKKQGKTDHYNEKKPQRKNKRGWEREKRWLIIVENGKKKMSIIKEKEKAFTATSVVRG